MKKVMAVLCIAFNSTAFGQMHCPSTKTVDVNDTYFGSTYKDPYRWIEDLKNPEAANWYKQQADFTNKTMEGISGKDELVAEWTNLSKLQPPDISERTYENGRIFYKKAMPDEKVARLYYRNGWQGKEILLFDPTTYINGKTLTIESILPSYDGKMVAIGYSESGAEISTIKVLNVDTRTFLAETIYPSWFGPISWTFDNKGFTYFSQKTGDNMSPEFELNTKTKLHVLGDQVQNDIDFFSNESYPNLGIASNELCFAWLNKDSKEYIFARLSNVNRTRRDYFAPIAELKNKKINWKVLCKREDKIVQNVVIGKDVYGITFDNAANYKLIKTSLLKPDWKHAEVIAPERKGLILTRITNCKDYLLLTYSDGINEKLFSFNFKSKVTSEVNLPYSGSLTVFCLDNSTNNCTVGITSWTKPYTEYDIDIRTKVLISNQFNAAPNYPEAYKNLVVKEVSVKGHDGTMIPLSIVYKRGTKLDGTNVCFMTSYGAYGISMNPEFKARWNALAVKDVILAFPHVRGGGEKGEKWYKAGYKTTKPNTWKDFNSCAEYLIENGYTSPKKIAGMGTSAGGILISRAITERPDLYGAAICNVGCANAMRGEFEPNGPANIPEFGTVKDSIECKALYEMDGVQHVVKGTAYPAIMCIAGWNDPRVIAWQPGKFAAALQNATTSKQPVLLKINYDNGHFTEDKSVTFANFADQLAFAMWQCGHPGFQPKK
jgi:prolyl oligopeptidase